MHASAQEDLRRCTRQPGCQELNVLPQLPAPGAPLLHCPALVHRTYRRLQGPSQGFSRAQALRGGQADPEGVAGLQAAGNMPACGSEH